MNVAVGAALISALTLIPSGPVVRPDDPPVVERKYLEGEARDPFLRQVEQAMESLDSLEARFDQEKHLFLFEDVVHTKGVIRFARPDHLRWEILEPFRSILVVSGDQVGKFEVKDGVKTRLELGRSGDVILMVMGRIRGWFRGRFADEGDEYDLRVSNDPTPLIELRPKDARMRKTLQAIEVHLAADLTVLRQVTIHEPGGDRTVLRFHDPRRNAPVVEGTFSVDDPRLLDAAD